MCVVGCSVYKTGQNVVLIVLVSSFGELGSFALPRICFVFLEKNASFLIMNLLRGIE